jgi:hypothetical protein
VSTKRNIPGGLVGAGLVCLATELTVPYEAYGLLANMATVPDEVYGQHLAVPWGDSPGN